MLESAIKGLTRPQCHPTAAGTITITKYRRGKVASVTEVTVEQTGHFVEEYGYGHFYKLPGSK